ncbi:MAG: hypothetical protein ACK5PF_09605 [bacterium]
MTNLPKLHQALHDASDEEIVGALHYLGKAARIAAALNAQEERLPPTMTPEEAREFQRWEGMDGAIAYQLIERHADGWADVGVMMNAWLEANALNAQAGVVEALLRQYVGLVESGDAGNWNAEEEDEVIAARAAIAAVKEKGRG